VEFVWEGAMTKRVHLGRAAQLGLESALLAQRGLTGPTTVLEGRYGYLQAFSPQPEPARLTEGLGKRWISAELTIKAYPAHSTAQAIVHALRTTQPLDPMRVRGVCVVMRGHSPEARFLDPAPTTMLGAQYSLPYAIATALCRDVSDPNTVREDILCDALIRAIASSVEVRADPDHFAPAPQEVTAEVQLDLGDGAQTIPVTSFPGSLSRPLDFTGACDKLRRYAQHVSTPERVARIIDMVDDLERLDDVSRLAHLLAAHPR
jgi:2-methylcitrate dehydratase PrpD